MRIFSYHLNYLWLLQSLSQKKRSDTVNDNGSNTFDEIDEKVWSKFFERSIGKSKWIRFNWRKMYGNIVLIIEMIYPFLRCCRMRNSICYNSINSKSHFFFLMCRSPEGRWWKLSSHSYRNTVSRSLYCQSSFIRINQNRCQWRHEFDFVRATVFASRSSSSTSFVWSIEIIYFWLDFDLRVSRVSRQIENFLDGFKMWKWSIKQRLDVMSKG